MVRIPQIWSSTIQIRSSTRQIWSSTLQICNSRAGYDPSTDGLMTVMKNILYNMEKAKRAKAEYARKDDENSGTSSLSIFFSCSASDTAYGSKDLVLDKM
ncbi:hypothetical protein Sjap_002368 [Stephania japonica]|uniref:Uncharacterized protein n=1 Tax=Stephania japonica TaxID=461633 RepID=A0AAP0KLT0_9MAGN